MKKTDSALLQDLISNILAKRNSNVPHDIVSKLSIKEVQMQMSKYDSTGEVLGRSDQTILDTSDRGSPEYVAWLHLKSIASCREMNVSDLIYSGSDQEWILTTYAACLKTVRDPHGVAKHIVR